MISLHLAGMFRFFCLYPATLSSDCVAFRFFCPSRRWAEFLPLWFLATILSVTCIPSLMNASLVSSMRPLWTVIEHQTNEKSYSVYLPLGSCWFDRRHKKSFLQLLLSSLLLMLLLLLISNKLFSSSLESTYECNPDICTPCPWLAELWISHIGYISLEKHRLLIKTRIHLSASKKPINNFC